MFPINPVKNKKNTKPPAIYPYKITSCNSHYPRFKELAQAHDVAIVNDIGQATAIYASSLKKLANIINKYPKKRMVVFTHEPYWDTNRKRVINYLGKKVHIINAYTGYYSNPYFYFPKKATHLYPKIPEDPINMAKFQTQKIRTCILASYHQELIGKTREGLCQTRNLLGKRGSDLGVVDVYGKGWPRGYSKEDSRGGKWKARKSDILEKYFFNICFENSHIENYISEKLWDSITCYTLPIYQGSKWIYQIFPKDSFIDYRQFDSPEDLFKFIKDMKYDEWCRRVNLCIQVYNHIIDTVDISKVKDDTYLRLVHLSKI